MDKPQQLPAVIQEKFDEMHDEVGHVVNIAFQYLVTNIPGPIGFTYTSSAPMPLLTKYEQAQSVCFVTKYHCLPTFERADIREKNGTYSFGNSPEARYVLNEYRSIIQNRNDSVYYQKLHKFCREKLLNNDKQKGLSIMVTQGDERDVTREFAQSLDERYKAIKSLIKQCEFAYIYNGILQHSDHQFSARFWKEYASGKINYVFMKHALIASNIKGLLEWHYRLFNVLTFPKLGPL
ncbi:MAG: hypothetical protein GWP14_00665 [Actinobacteria bacterium]|nr:hypothetical protein [Actinomycetota bacterium]